MDFKEKVQSMTGKEIVMAMVSGLQKEHVVIDMDTYGDAADNVCYGCAATNTICEISGVMFTPENISGEQSRAVAVGATRSFIADFETAVDCLRRGWVVSYNAYARVLDMARLPVPRNELPRLTSQTYKENLQYYIDYANSL